MKNLRKWTALAAAMMEAFYNTKRIHSHCNYMSPNEFKRVYKRTHTETELLAG